MNEPYAMLIGLDWADQKHDLAVSRPDGSRYTLQIAAAPEAIDEWVEKQRRKIHGGRIAVCLEQSRGALFYMLSKYEEIDLYPVNPAQLARYREAFAPSRAKNDRRDAELLLDLLERHGESLRRVEPDQTAMRRLAGLCEARRRCVDERTRNGLVVQAHLKIIFPQALELCAEKLHGALSLDFLERWPTLTAFQRARRATVVEFFKNHRAGEIRITRALSIHASGVSATEEPAVIEPILVMIAMRLAMLRAANKAIEAYEKAIEETAGGLAEYEIFASFPGAGKALAPRLTAAFGSDRSRWPSVEDLQAYAGVAPVTEESGKSRWVHWRWSCPKFLRQTFVEYAKESLRRSVWARVYYDRLRERGKSHNQALRALAFKWTRILWRCWRDRKPYEEERYISALERNGSWIAQLCHEN